MYQIGDVVIRTGSLFTGHLAVITDLPRPPTSFNYTIRILTEPHTGREDRWNEKYFDLFVPSSREPDWRL